MKNPKSNFSEWYTEVIQDAELADIRYNVKGFLAHMPWSVRTMKKMYLILEDELRKRGMSRLGSLHLFQSHISRKRRSMRKAFQLMYSG